MVKAIQSKFNDSFSPSMGHLYLKITLVSYINI